MSHRRQYFLSLLIICLSSALFYHILTLTNSNDTVLNGSLTNKSLFFLPTPGNSYKFNQVELGLDNFTIKAFSALTSEDIWAVGNIGVDDLVVHFDGTSWNRIPFSGGKDLEAIQALSHDNIWAVGGCNNEAYLIHFDGKEWVSYGDLPLPPVESWQEEYRCPLALEMLDNQEGWVVGRYGMLLYFKAGIWTQFKSPINSVDLTKIDMVSKDEGWVVAGKEYEDDPYPLLHYLNGKWNLDDLLPPSKLNDIKMLSRQEGWVIGAHGTVLKYLNNEWIQVPIPNGRNLLKIIFADDEEILIGGAKVILHGINDQWTSYNLYTNWNDIVMTSSQSGWISSASTLFRMEQNIEFSSPKSPSGDLAYINSGGGISSINMNNSETKILFNKEDGYTVLYFSWLPNGKKISIAYAEHDSVSLFKVLILDLSDGTIQDLNVHATSPYHSWSPDGKKLAIIDSGIIIYSILDKKTIKLISDPDITNLSWSNCGDVIAFIHKEALYTINLNDNNIKDYWLFEKMRTVDWSPNDKSFLISNEDSLSSEISIFPKESSSALLSSFIDGDYASWSYDNWIAYDYKNIIYIYNYNFDRGIVEGRIPKWKPNSDFSQCLKDGRQK